MGLRAEGFNRSETAFIEGLLRGLASSLGFRETRRGLYSLDVSRDTRAFIDFRGTWKGWRYAFKGSNALREEELAEIEPLRRFKELRDRILGGEARLGMDGAGRALILPVAGVKEVSRGLRILDEVKSEILVAEDYLYLDEDGNTVSKDNAVVKRLRRSGLRKLAYAYGLDFLIIGMERHEGNDGDSHYTWMCHALVVEPRSGRFVESIGACSSGDLFFSRAPCEADVILGAQTQAVGRGIADLLGLNLVEG